jgi:hypothetical protein
MGIRIKPPVFALLWLLLLALPSLAVANANQSDSALTEHWRQTYQELAAGDFPRAATDLALFDIYQDLELRSDDIEQLLQDDESSEAQQFTLWQDTLALLRVRAELIDAAPSRSAGKIVGFGPSGVRNMQLELRLYRLSAGIKEQHLYSGFGSFSKDMLLSPVPLLIAILEILFIVAFFIYWRRRCVPAIVKFNHVDNGDKRTLPQWVSWWYLRLRKPLEWFLLLSAVFAIAADLLFFVRFFVYQTIVDWLLLGAVAIYFIDTALGYRSSSSNNEIAERRLKSLKLIGYTIIFIGLISSALESLELAWGTIEHWFKTLYWLVMLPVAYTLLRWWRPYVFERLRQRRYRDMTVAKMLLANKDAPLSILYTLAGILFLMVYQLASMILTSVSEQELVRSWMAYLFRIEVARQSAKDDNSGYQPISSQLESCFGLHTPSSYYNSDVAAAERRIIADKCIDARPTIGVVYAARGMGRSHFLRSLAEQLSDQKQTVIVQAPLGDFSDLLPAIGKALGLEQDAPSRDIVNTLKEDVPRVICIDDVQRIITPTISGLKELDRLVRLMRRSSSTVSWVMTIETSCWRFIELARGERFLFDREIALPPWSEKNIAGLISARNKQAEVEPNFSTLVLPRQMGRGDEPEEKAAMSSYARILWDYSKGSPGITLLLWQQSLFEGQLNEFGELDPNGEKHIIVRLFDIPDAALLDSMRVTSLLVLRAIMQLEQGTKDEIASCINLSSEEVVDALRRLSSAGYLISCDGYYQIVWSWYHAISTVLVRQHLLRL